jgi:hypothetical protein
MAEKLVQEPIGPPGDDRGEGAFHWDVAAPHVRPKGTEAAQVLLDSPP